MNYSNKIKSYSKKTITNEELKVLFNKNCDEELFEIVTQLEDEKLLQKIKSSKTNGNKLFPIYSKYKITYKESYEDELLAILKLHPLLQKNNYLKSKPQEYKKYKELLDLLDTYLFKTPTDLIPISRKERSFQIFNEEKALDDTSFYRLLNNIGLDKENLYFYDTPEYCFNDFIPQKKDNMTLLICENKDIWFNIRRIMFEDKLYNIFSTHIEGVIYGCGNKISQKDALTQYTQFMGNSNINYLYWGDIDRAGLNIFLSLKKANPNLSINLFKNAYSMMLNLSESISLPNSDDKREILDDYTNIFNLFNEKENTLLKEYITNNKRLPQEIISYAVLKENMR